jgi:hypothetical protein
MHVFSIWRHSASFFFVRFPRLLPVEVFHSPETSTSIPSCAMRAMSFTLIV